MIHCDFEYRGFKVRTHRRANCEYTRWGENQIHQVFPGSAPSYDFISIAWRGDEICGGRRMKDRADSQQNVMGMVDILVNYDISPYDDLNGDD